MPAAAPSTDVRLNGFAPDENPFATDLCVTNSRYYSFKAGKPTLVADPTRVPELLDATIAGAFRGFVQAPQFSCVGAKSAVTRDNYRLGVYSRLGSAESTAGLARDLFTFSREAREIPVGDFITFAAAFQEPTDGDEYDFERLLWSQLRSLHARDRELFEWDTTVSSDPASADFSFSFAGTAFFVVGLHPNSSRIARRFPWPLMVFNIHAQFMQLRADGRWDRLQQVIRARDEALQGSLNPNLADHGKASEARQYSGRAVEPEWQAPFVPKSKGGCPFGHGGAKS